uniref:Secreted protein n=1 Tax=Macrostomum lignano TaxID=282301 RepID=A0A1I8JQ82_9PLAT
NCMGTAGMRLLVLTAALLQLACGQIDYAKWSSDLAAPDLILVIHHCAMLEAAAMLIRLDAAAASTESVKEHDQGTVHEHGCTARSVLETFVFVECSIGHEDQSSLSLKAGRNGPVKKRAVVYKAQSRIRCDGLRAMQHPFGDMPLRASSFEEANPENQRSIHMSLGRRHQLNCTRGADDQRYFVRLPAVQAVHRQW